MIPRTEKAALSRSTARRGGAFSLIESLVAVTILGTIMLAVVAALSASQGVAFDGQKRILASIACDDLLSELSTLEYDDLPSHDGTTHEVGEMVTLDGVAYPGSFWAIGRSVAVEPSTMSDEQSGATVVGRMVTVTSFDATASLMSAQLFVSDPNVVPDPEEEEEEEEEGAPVKGGGLIGGLLGGLLL